MSQQWQHPADGRSASLGAQRTQGQPQPQQLSRPRVQAKHRAGPKIHGPPPGPPQDPPFTDSWDFSQGGPALALLELAAAMASPPAGSRESGPSAPLPPPGAGGAAPGSRVTLSGPERSPATPARAPCVREAQGGSATDRHPRVSPSPLVNHPCTAGDRDAAPQGEKPPSATLPRPEELRAEPGRAQPSRSPTWVAAARPDLKVAVRTEQSPKPSALSGRPCSVLPSSSAGQPARPPPEGSAERAGQRHRQHRGRSGHGLGKQPHPPGPARLSSWQQNPTEESAPQAPAEDRQRAGTTWPVTSGDTGRTCGYASAKAADHEAG